MVSYEGWGIIMLLGDCDGAARAKASGVVSVVEARVMIAVVVEEWDEISIGFSVILLGYIKNRVMLRRINKSNPILDIYEFPNLIGYLSQIFLLAFSDIEPTSL